MDTALAKVIKSSDIGRCPKKSLMAEHYRKDGTCRCDEREAAQTALAKARAEFQAARRACHQARLWLKAT